MFQVSKEASCSSEATEDSVLLQLQQLSLPRYCLLCLFHTVPHLGPSSGLRRENPALLAAELVQLFAMCVKQSIWSSTDPIAQEVSQHLQQVLMSVGEVLEKYRYWLNNQNILQNQGFWFSCPSYSLNIFSVCGLSSNKTCPSVCLLPYTSPLHMGCLASHSDKTSALFFFTICGLSSN